ncbi:hypothetical protein V1478_007794, partial [Vespula squamosa]
MERWFPPGAPDAATLRSGKPTFLSKLNTDSTIPDPSFSWIVRTTRRSSRRLMNVMKYGKSIGTDNARDIHRQRPIVVVAVIVVRAKHHPSLDRDVCVPKDLPGQRFRVSTLAFISLTFRTLRYIGGNEEKNNRRTLPQQWLFDERQIRRWNPHRKALEAGKDIPREFRARRRNICQAVAA